MLKQFYFQYIGLRCSRKFPTKRIMTGLPTQLLNRLSSHLQLTMH